MITGLALAAASSVLILLFPFFQQARYTCLLCFSAAAAYYRWEFMGFLLVSGIFYAALCWLSREADRARCWRWACVAIVALVAVFTLGRAGHWDRPVQIGGWHPISLFSLGMWPALRLVTVFWEVGAGSVAVPSLAQYVLWTCLPFTLVGPNLRFSQMPRAVFADRQVLKSAGWWMEASAATAKLLVGGSLGPGHHWLTTHLQHLPHAHFLNNAVATFLTGPLSFYLTTAGYFHWMELLGRPAGFKLPESFRYPLGRENISAFWMNWNMTATYVFRDYLFYNRWGRRRYNVYFNTILLFTLVGLWHAANAYWILWGFLHGLLFTSFLLWRRYSPRLGQIPLRGTVASETAARVFTYFSVCMCWYLPSKILQKFGGVGS